MNANKKFIIVLVGIAIFFMLSGGWLVEKFRRDPIKKEFKEAEKRVEILRDSLKLIRSENAKELEELKKSKSNVTKKYKKAAAAVYSTDQLDSLRAEFKRKTGS